MERDQTPATNEQGASTIDRRRLLRGSAALGLAMPAVGILASSAAAQEAVTATPAASPAASPMARACLQIGSRGGSETRGA